jgi:predicted RNA-binding Zn ribbon-like protein
VVDDSVPVHELRFRFLGGRPCLDFVATVGERWRRNFERLREPGDLGRWLVEEGLLASAPPVAAAELQAARELREAIFRTARLAGQGTPEPADVGVLNAWAARPALAPQLDGHGRTLAWQGSAADALASLARDALDLVTGPYAHRVRQCAADDCALMFVDTSRPGRRRWCSMDRCGNRTKTATYRRRRSDRQTEENV